jgi:energy-coupling factor transport system ATP-binding protein
MTDAPPLVEVQDVSFGYGDPGEPLALRGVRLTLRAGELVALTGANGSGKTTLAKHLNGLLRPRSGRVLIDGQNIADRSLGQLAQTVGYVFQNPDHQIFLPTVAEEVAYGPRNLGLRGAALEARTAETLAQFSLRHLADRHPTLLGRGLRRRVALAAVVAMRPRLLVLDEPTGGLDRRATDDLLDLLQARVAGGGSVVLITHDMRLVGERAERMVLLRAGEVVADGPTRTVMRDAGLLASAGLRQPPVTRLAAALAPAGMPLALDVPEFCAAFLDALAARAPRSGRGGSQP